ncbi:hypothetical protein AAG906_040193 [Vitis piasezkii]
MPTEGHEEEILVMLKRIKARKGLNGQKCDRKKDKSKLERLVSYKGTNSESRANDRNKRMVLKSFIKTQKLDLVWIQETKIQDMSLVFWDSKVLELVGMEVAVYSIACWFKNCDDGDYGMTHGVLGATCCKIPLGAGPSSFRFENMWLKEEDFKELVKSWWMTFNFRGSLSFDLVEKLKSLIVTSIKTAMGVLNGDKALGPNDFSLAFWQHRWDVVKVKVLSFFKEFHEHGCFAKNLNATFLVLVPKRGEAEELKDFMLITNETIDSMLRSNRAGVLCKLDIEKAYDHSARDLRRGDPLSSYLFVLAMEVLSCLLGRVREGGYLFGFKVLGRNGEGLEISYLLFADDTLVFCEATSFQMTYLSWLFMWFEAISDLKINLDKSELIPVGRVSNVMELVAISGCKVGVLPTTYLGLPLGTAHNLVVAWDRVEERELEGDWCSKEVRGSYGVGLWKAIRLLWEFVSSRTLFVVGNGRRVKFWRDRWCGDEPLCVSFPSLFALASLKEVWVADLWVHYSEGGWIEPKLRRWNASCQGFKTRARSLEESVESSSFVPLLDNLEFFVQRSGSWSLNLGLWERSRKTNLDSSKSSNKIWPENEEEEIRPSKMNKVEEATAGVDRTVETTASRQSLLLLPVSNLQPLDKLKGPQKHAYQPKSFVSCNGFPMVPPRGV